MLISILTIVLAAIAVMAAGFGVDSRDEFDDRRRSPYPTGLR